MRVSSLRMRAVKLARDTLRVIVAICAHFVESSPAVGSGLKCPSFWQDTLPTAKISGMEKFTLNEANATDLIEQIIGGRTPVALVGLDYNWGPPVSGRCDQDFYQIWAAARIDLQPKSVRLLANYDQYGCPQSWSDKRTFDFVKDCGTHRLYFLSVQSPFSEFVIKLETEGGHVYYDNNGGFGVNYRIVPYSGRGTTAVAGNGAIWNLKGIVPISLLWRRHDGVTTKT